MEDINLSFIEKNFFSSFSYIIYFSKVVFN